MYISKPIVNLMLHHKEMGRVYLWTTVSEHSIFLIL